MPLQRNQNKTGHGSNQLSWIDKQKRIETTTHAMPAACNVEMKPAIIALGPMRAMMRVRDGASADKTPI